MKVISTLSTLFLLLILTAFSGHGYAEDPLSSPTTILNINTASPEQISQHLKGIGLKKAQAIVAYRQNYGEFQLLEELTAVKGIGQATLEKNRHLISLE